ncbi:YjgF-like protein [Trametes polyzona]|nr:YjgF-like protein [Trametes polyzona]
MFASSTESRRVQTANPYEKEFGYSRAVRRGPLIAVSGTTSIDPASGQLRHPGSAYEQARATFAEIIRAVEELGGTAADIVRVRMFVTHGADSDSVGRALKEALGDVGPAATMIAGAQFVSPEMLVEIEADAFVMVSVTRSSLMA